MSDEYRYDFFRVCVEEPKNGKGPVKVFPDFIVGRSKDLMVRGQSFYAIYDPETGLWSTDEYDVQRLVDTAVTKYADELSASGVQCSVKLLRSYSSNSWNQFRKFLKNVSDNAHQLDMNLTFANTEVKKGDYVSRRLPYSLAIGDYSAWDELVGTLYSPEERAKIEWAIGSVVAGDSKKIEKFLVFYGPGGTGKSTIMKIIQKLFEGYIAIFEAKALVGNNNSFATAAFKTNPLVAIQHDGDLSKIEDNSTLNSVVGHDLMTINEKYKPSYEMVVSAFLFMGTNKPVKITDAKSGLIRRLIDVSPTGNTFSHEHYLSLMARIEFELGAIAQHCLDVYKKMGKSYYNGYQPRNMMFQTDAFFNFVDEHFHIFEQQDGTTLKQAWELYKAWADDAELGYKMQKHKFREELKNYFDEFNERTDFNGTRSANVYRRFTAQQFKEPVPMSEPKIWKLVMDSQESVIDEMYSGLPAQYANSRNNPKLYWDDSVRYDKKTGKEFIPKPDQIVSTVLGDLDTTRLHFLKVPEHHIVIDFDLKGDDGKKSLEKNLEAASLWPATYAEISQGGEGVHLHYTYDGDPNELASVYSEGIEIKVFTGNSSLRRRLSWCNNVSVAAISSGLPFREKKPVISESKLRNEQGLRDMIKRNLQREFHSSTKSSIDFIKHILDEAYREGYPYDVSNMRQKIMLFAGNSTNQREACMRAVAQMHFTSKVAPEDAAPAPEPKVQDERIVFFDCEVYPNLFVVCWKYHGDGDNCVTMINPTPQEIESLVFNFKLVGYNNRSYDNHIMWARMLGATNEELYRLSQKIIVDKDENAKFGEAWGASYADVLDFLSVKQTLKKWQIDLGYHHMEMDIPWDKPVPKERVKDVVEYCCNDVRSLEKVFDANQADFQARKILASMSGLTVNNSTRQHAIKIMFGDERNPQKDFVYTDLSERFPSYEFDEYAKLEKSWYREEPVGEGGYVYAEPGIHYKVALLDVASMHPTSLIELNYFGPYTEKFVRLVEARLAIKHGDFERANELLPGIQVTKENAKALSNALKLVINSIYGYTCAKFDNPFRDKRNKDNIIAKRGALFMIDLKHAVQEQGFTVVHIKTDSIKIADATPDIIAFVQEFGANYGYTFEHEATYSKMCLANDAVYVAKVEETDPPGAYESAWTATGAQFQHPFVFKALFTHEPVTFPDLCETKQVKKGAMYLRYPEGDLVIGSIKDEAIPENELAEADPNYGDIHVGRSGLFVPINPDQDFIKGGDLVCVRDGKDYAVAGTKGYKWAEAEMVKALENGAIERMVFEDPTNAVQGTGSIADIIDFSYFNELAEEAYQTIAKFGDADEFLEDEFASAVRGSMKVAA